MIYYDAINYELSATTAQWPWSIPRAQCRSTSSCAIPSVSQFLLFLDILTDKSSYENTFLNVPFANYLSRLANTLNQMRINFRIHGHPWISLIRVLFRSRMGEETACYRRWCGPYRECRSRGNSVWRGCGWWWIEKIRVWEEEMNLPQSTLV